MKNDVRIATNGTILFWIVLIWLQGAVLYFMLDHQEKKLNNIEWKVGSVMNTLADPNSAEDEK